MRKVNREFELFIESRKTKPRVRYPSVLKTFFKRYAGDKLRSFPWRDRNASAYEVLLVEVLLKQTRAQEVVPVWRELHREYPDPLSLSRAKLRSLLGLIRPLGLHYQRAKALKRIGSALVERFDGDVPRATENLLSLPYVGLYTALAVSCFTFGKRVPIVDSNVLRVFSRIAGVNFGKDIRRTQQAWSLAWQILPRRNARLHNYGLLDFAALICTPRLPRCSMCPIRLGCAYGRANFRLGR